MARPSKSVPYPYIRGLNQRDQYQLEEDFAYILAQFEAGLTIFDAIIDPSLTASLPGSHQYKNLTELVANETWLPHYNFIVGVKQRNNPRIVEPNTTITISTLGDLSLFGLGPVQPDDVNTKGWDWATLNCTTGQNVHYYNLSIMPHSTGT